MYTAVVGTILWFGLVVSRYSCGIHTHTHTHIYIYIYITYGTTKCNSVPTYLAVPIRVKLSQSASIKKPHTSPLPTCTNLPESVMKVGDNTVMHDHGRVEFHQCYWRYLHCG